MSLYVCPSPCKVTICSLRTSVNDEFPPTPTPHCMDVETIEKDHTTITQKTNDQQIMTRLTVPWAKLDDAIKISNDVTQRHSLKGFQNHA